MWIDIKILQSVSIWKPAQAGLCLVRSESLKVKVSKETKMTFRPETLSKNKNKIIIIKNSNILIINKRSFMKIQLRLLDLHDRLGGIKLDIQVEHLYFFSPSLYKRILQYVIQG